MSGFFFSNPAGLWALLGLPAILAIHMLQQKSRQHVISTLFLLEAASRVSEAGRKIDRVRQSLPMWLQLLAVLCLAWVLADPRWLRQGSVQQVIVVMDSTASMGAFREDAIAGLQNYAGRLSRTAHRTEWLVAESDRSLPSLYQGDDTAEMLDAVRQDWKPLSAAMDPVPVFRGLGGAADAVRIFVTDHGMVVPDGVRVLSAGAPEANVGIAGMNVSEDSYEATVVNFSTEPARRQWWVETGEGRSQPQELTLGPQQMKTVTGAFQGDAMTLVIEGDALNVDDRATFVRPLPRPLHLAMLADREFLNPLAATLENVVDQPADGVATLLVATVDGMAQFEGSGIFFRSEPDSGEAANVLAQIVAADHALMRDLNWSGLMVRRLSAESAQPPENAQVLLWAGQQPLAWMEESGAVKKLVLDFDPQRSNAPAQPAFALLLHRFAEIVRAGGSAMVRWNFEPRESLGLSARDAAVSVTLSNADGVLQEVPGHQAPLLRAPREPGFFEVTGDGVMLISGAVHFADAREMDLQNAGELDELAGLDSQLMDAQSERDGYAVLWLFAAGGMMAGAWWASRERRVA